MFPQSLPFKPTVPVVVIIHFAPEKGVTIRPLDPPVKSTRRLGDILPRRTARIRLAGPSVRFTCRPDERFQIRVLALEDGSVFRGPAWGGTATVVGEAVFNTSMTGYQEIVTDPSYYRQIVTMTAPQIGNYGVNDSDEESSGPKVFGFVVRELSPIRSNWRGNRAPWMNTSAAWDSRHPGCGHPNHHPEAPGRRRDEGLPEHRGHQRRGSHPPGSGLERPGRVRLCQGSHGKEPSPGIRNDPGNAPYLPIGTTLNQPPPPERRFKVAAFDLGAKYSIFRRLVRHGFDVTVLPATLRLRPSSRSNPTGSFSPMDRATRPRWIMSTYRHKAPDDGVSDLRHLSRTPDDHPCSGRRRPSS